MSESTTVTVGLDVHARSIRLAAVRELATRMPPLYQTLELDLARSVLETYLRWLNRTEKALSRDIRAGE